MTTYTNTVFLKAPSGQLLGIQTDVDGNTITVPIDDNNAMYVEIMDLFVNNQLTINDLIVNVPPEEELDANQQFIQEWMGKYQDLVYFTPMFGPQLIKGKIDGFEGAVPVDVTNKDYQVIMKLVELGVLTVQPEVTSEVVMASEVSARQARLALLQVGLLDQIQAAIEQIGGAAAIEWEYATVIQKSSPLVSALSASLGLSSTQVDDLFQLASTL